MTYLRIEMAVGLHERMSFKSCLGGDDIDVENPPVIYRSPENFFGCTPTSAAWDSIMIVTLHVDDP